MPEKLVLGDPVEVGAGPLTLGVPTVTYPPGGEPGWFQTASGNLMQGLVGSFTDPIEYIGDISGWEFLGKAGKAVDRFVEELIPVDPERTDDWLATKIPRGLGQVAGVLIPGAGWAAAAGKLSVAAKAAAAAGNTVKAAELTAKALKVSNAGKATLIGMMGGAEGHDAFERSVREGDDFPTAVAKSLGYASVASAIEYRWGAGLLARRLNEVLGREGAELAAKDMASKAESGLLLKTLEDFGTGVGEEASQRLAQDIIVTGRPDIGGITEEGALGGIIQALVGLPLNIAKRSMTGDQRLALASAERLAKAGAPKTAEQVLKEMFEATAEVPQTVVPPEEPVAAAAPVASAPTVTTEPAAPAAAAPGAPAAVQPAVKAEKVTRVSTPKLTTGSAELEFEIVDASEVKTSDDAGYNQELQNRMRGLSRTSTEQIIQIASNPLVEQLAGSNRSDVGSPIINRQGEVIVGNGRTTALRMMYAGANAAVQERYRNFVAAMAKEYGLESQLAGKAQPLLVRRVRKYEGISEEQFAIESNTSGLLAETPAEQALNDAQAIIDNNLLETIQPGLEGDLFVAQNRDFLFGLAAARPDMPRTTRGDISPLATQRVENALMGAALLQSGMKREELQEMAVTLVERARAEGMASRLPAIAKSAIQLSRLGPEYNISGDFMRAVRALMTMRREMRESPGLTREEWLANQGHVLFDAPSPVAMYLTRKLMEAGKPSQISEFIRAYRTLAEKEEEQLREKTTDMFGGREALPPLKLFKKAEKMVAEWTLFDLEKGRQSLAANPLLNPGLPDAIQEQDVAQAAAEFQKNFAEPVAVEVVNEPGWTQEGRLVEAEYRMEKGRPSVTINLAAVKTLEDVKRLLVHELVVHHGLETLLGSQVEADLRELGETVSDADLSVIAGKYKLDLADTRQRHLALIEHIAARAEVEGGRSAFSKLLVKIWDWVRRLFGSHSTEADIRRLLAAAHRALAGPLMPDWQMLMGGTPKPGAERAPRIEYALAPQLQTQNDPRLSTALDAAIGMIASPPYIYQRQTAAWRVEATAKLLAAFDQDLEAALTYLSHPDTMSGLDDASRSVALALLSEAIAARWYDNRNNPVQYAHDWNLYQRALLQAKLVASAAGQALQAQQQVAEILFSSDALRVYNQAIAEKQQAIGVMLGADPARRAANVVAAAGQEAASSMADVVEGEVAIRVRGTDALRNLKGWKERLVDAKTMGEVEGLLDELGALLSPQDFGNVARALSSRKGELWEEAKKRMGKRLATLLLPPGKPKVVPRFLQDMFASLLREASQRAKEVNPQTAQQQQKLTDEERLREILNNLEKYRDVLAAAKVELERKYANEPHVLAWADAKIGMLFDSPLSTKSLGAIFARRLSAERISIPEEAQFDSGRIGKVKESVLEDVAQSLGPGSRGLLADAFDAWIAQRLAKERLAAAARGQREEAASIEDFEDYRDYIAERIAVSVRRRLSGKARPPPNIYRQILRKVEADVRRRLEAEPKTVAKKTAEERIAEKAALESMEVTAFNETRALLSELALAHPEMRAAIEPMLAKDFDFEAFARPSDIAFSVAVKDLGIVFSDLLIQSAITQATARLALHDKIMGHPALAALSPEQKAVMTRKIEEEWQRRRNRVLYHHAKQLLPKDAPDAAVEKMRQSLPRIIRLANLGLLDNAAIRNALAEAYGIDTFSEETAQKIWLLSQEAQQKPEGAQRNEAFRAVVNTIKRDAGIKTRDLVSSWWFGAVLSGMGTQGRNILGNTALGASNFAAFASREPGSIPSLVGAMLRGFRMNSQGEFSAILLRGAEVGRPGTSDPREDIKLAAGAAEIAANDARGWARFLALSRYVSRFMLAVDSFFYDANVEVMATFSAYREAKVLGDKAAMEGFITRQLGIGPEAAAKAKSQAAGEIAAGITHPKDLERRTNEIIRQGRRPDIIEATHQYGLEATLNNTPEGLLGLIARMAMTARHKYPMLTPVVPFIRISANVGNMLLNHSPVGLVQLLAFNQNLLSRDTRAEPRQFWGKPLRLTTDGATLEGYQQLRAKVLLSHAALIGFAAMAADDDEDFTVHGGFRNLSPTRRRQLESQGLRPYSVKIGGVSLEYRQTPFALIFAMLGNYLDGVKYGELEEKELGIKAATALAGGHAVIIDQQFLGSLITALGMGGRGNQAAATGNWFGNFLGRIAGGLAPGILKDFDRMIDPDARRVSGFWSHFQKEVPVARWYAGEPLYNVLGEQVQVGRYPWSWFARAEEDSPIWQVLGDKALQGVFVPAPSAAAKIRRDGKLVKMSAGEFAQYSRRVGVLYRERISSDLDRVRRMTPAQAQAYMDRLKPLRDRVRRQLGLAGSETD